MTKFKSTNGSMNLKLLNILQTYVIPFIVSLVGAGMLWASLNNVVTSNVLAIGDLKVQCDQTESTINLVLQRLASIDAKLEYIIKEIDSK